MIYPKVRFSRVFTAAFVTAASVYLACGSACAETPVPASPVPPSPEELLKVGDQHDAKLEAKQALACFLEVEKAQPDNADVLVRIARQYRHLMTDASSESDKLKYGSCALQYGKRAAALAPKNSDAQLSCAISYGKMLPMMAKKEQVSSSKLIKDGAEKAIKLNQNNDLAWNILGRWHRNVANMGAITRALAAMIYEKIPTGTNEDSVKCLEQAIKINPRRIMHYVELGRTYAQMGRHDDARRFIEKALGMPCVDKDDQAMKATGREVLASIR